MKHPRRDKAGRPMSPRRVRDAQTSLLLCSLSRTTFVSVGPPSCQLDLAVEVYLTSACPTATTPSGTTTPTISRRSSTEKSTGYA